MHRRIALVSVHGDPAAAIGTEAAGGQNVYVREVGRQLAALGYEVDMFTRAISPDQPRLVPMAPGCRTVRLVAGPLEYVPRDQLHVHVDAFVERLVEYARKHGSYDVVHTNYWLSGLVGQQLRRRLDLPQVHTYHSLGAIKYMNVAEVPTSARLRLAAERQILENAERIVATSPQEAEHMRRYVSQKGLIDIIPCGVDAEHFAAVEREEARRTLGWGTDEQVVFYVGRFDRRKGIETLVRAVARLPMHARLVIGGGWTEERGDGQEYHRIRSIVEELGLAERTVFPGRIDQSELPTYYTAADVVVVPSHYEPFGLVAVEAMACGTPVVASAVGGLCYSIVDGETGLLVAPCDVEAFAEAIGGILADDTLRRRLGEAGVRRIHDHFTWAGVSRKLARLYEQLATRKLRQRPTVRLA